MTYKLICIPSLLIHYPLSSFWANSCVTPVDSLSLETELSPSLAGQDLFEDDRASNSTDPIRKPKKGRPGSPYVKCGRWTNRVVNIGDYNEGVFEADKNVKKCVVNYQVRSENVFKNCNKILFR